MLACAVQQREAAIWIHTSCPAQTFLAPSCPSQPSWYHKAPSFVLYKALCSCAIQQSVLHTIGCIRQCYSLSSFYPFLPSLCPHLYSCPANRVISTIFLDSSFLLWAVLVIYYSITDYTKFRGLQLSSHLPWACNPEKTITEKDPCTPVFTEVLFLMVRT